MTYPTLMLQPTDAAQLNQYQHAKRDPQSGLVWIEDGTAGVAHSAHPNIEANKITHKMHPNYSEARGFLYSPDIFTSTDLDKIAAKYCRCAGCLAAGRGK